MTMLTHICIDPTDQYGEAEVVVVFKKSDGAIRLITVTDTGHHDILPDLEEVQRQDLLHEIAEAFRGPARLRAQESAC
ncbi:hypothetical protein MKL09_23540 [Methylobacterium sp. J-048]|uniref:hypothetical protein n=1 Tax=Methylobacterium sp. J-048 TaxID=2836635 RepID=UPI001FBBDB38|nr:hypothetical protein [Methylobacterium sp. J-048]MCJ2059501.1 hypothetical protein [Methylobacterium sp. J-048]